MSYQALARKWRPRNFTEVVGQMHVVKALSNALDQQRLHHAYLFTGTRGVGKTTLARIFAKCLNCEAGTSAAPCGACSACQEIDEGRYIDLIEVDAASRTKVEDTRELLDNVQYSPTRGHFKVYLIDEVHMLSGHSFNALLKTLEEPPSHVKFLLATTDPQKLPMTVLSRCLQFNLKKLPDDAVVQQLEKIMQAEDVPFEKSALHAIARVADGSMRDALSLQDQAIAYSKENVTDSAMHEMLGTVPREYMHKLMQALIDEDAARIMRYSHELAQLSADFSALFEDLIGILHQAAIFQAVPDIQGPSGPEGDLVELLAKQRSPEDIQLFYQIALVGRRDMNLYTSQQGALEMTLLRMLTFRQADQKHSGQDVQLPPTDAVTEEIQERVESPQDVQESVEPPQKHLLSELAQNECWYDLVEKLNVQGATKNLAERCSVEAATHDSLVLNLAKQDEGIAIANARRKLQQALDAYFSQNVKLEITLTDQEIDTPAKEKTRALDERQSLAEKHVEEDEVVKAFRSSFGAEVITGSVKPIGE
ncbi:MAG: DNA polymerase III subunit gamma/tau [Gammaproteobacteria bacterium]|nr:DNA polymerase III subunit gamma/tau [Gammaproteobacteria bacterium]